MRTILEQIVADAARSAIAATASIADLEQAKARFLGKAGSLTELLKGLGKLSAEERPKAGRGDQPGEGAGRGAARRRSATRSSRASSTRASPPKRST